MESNISRDHIALEVMKIILDKQMIETKKMFSEKGRFGIPVPQETAELAYRYADAMIAERNRKEEE